MKRIRWIRVFIWGLVLAIIVALLVPSRPTYDALLTVQPGMTLKQVESQFGKPSKMWHRQIIGVSSGDHTLSILMQSGVFWKSSMSVEIDSHVGVSFKPETSLWVGDTHLLWVEHENGVVTKAWLFPITFRGGGVEGCFKSIRDYWNQ